MNAKNVPNTVPKRAQTEARQSGPPKGITVYRRTMSGGHVSGTYYCRFRYRDKDGIVRQPQLDTGTNDYRAAVKWACAQKAALTSGQKSQVLAARMSMDRPNVARVDELLKAWKTHQHGANDATSARTLNSFRMIWREALDTDNETLGKMPVSALTKPALMQWIAARQGLPRPDFRRAIEANNGIIARLREMRSIISPKNRHFWHEAGIAVGDFEHVLSVPMPEATDTPFRWISGDALTAMEKAADECGDDNLTRAFWMMRLLAMRNCEVAACRVGWAETMDGKRYLRLSHRPDENFNLKRRENVRFLEIPARLLPWFEGPAGEYLLDGSKTERENLVFRRLNLLVRRFVPDREKGAYELRKQRISEELVDTGSIAAAAALAGDLVSTIERHYIDISRNLASLKIHRAKVIEGGIPA
jgi:hypothetical protein